MILQYLACLVLTTKCIRCIFNKLSFWLANNFSRKNKHIISFKCVIKRKDVVVFSHLSACAMTCIKLQMYINR